MIPPTHARSGISSEIPKYLPRDFIGLPSSQLSATYVLADQTTRFLVCYLRRTHSACSMELPVAVYDRAY